MKSSTSTSLKRGQMAGQYRCFTLKDVFRDGKMLRKLCIGNMCGVYVHVRKCSYSFTIPSSHSSSFATAAYSSL